MQRFIRRSQFSQVSCMANCPNFKCHGYDNDCRCSDASNRYQIVGNHYDDVIMSAMASQITSLTIVYSTVYSGVDQRKHQSSAPLAFVRGIHRGPVNSPHKGPVTRKMFPFDDVIMHHDIMWRIRLLRATTLYVSIKYSTLPSAHPLSSPLRAVG